MKSATCPKPLEPPSHLPLHPVAPGCHGAPDLSSLHHTADFHGCLNFTLGICFNATLSFCPTLSFLLCPQGCSLSAWPLLPCRKAAIIH